MGVFLQPIYTQTVGSGGIGNITFNNIPQTFTDLKVVASTRLAGAATALGLSMGVNGAYTLQTNRYVSGNGSAASAGSASNYLGDTVGSTATASVFGSLEVYIPNYTSSTFKQYIVDAVSENNATLSYTELWAGLWSSTSAITSLSFAGGSNLLQYSTISLYGILRSGV